MNIAFRYAYENGYRGQWGLTLVLHNPLCRPVGEIKARVKATLDEGTHFIAEQTYWLDSLAPYVRGEPMTERDHCWHKLVEVGATHDQPAGGLTVEHLLAGLEQAAAAGWEFFLPEQRYPDSAPGKLVG